MATKQHVLITGATGGIGYELAKVFAENGYDLLIVAKDENALQKTAEELRQLFHVKVETISKDLFKRNSAFELYDELRSRNIPIDVLVNDSGWGQYGEFTESDIPREIDIIQLNIISFTVVLTMQFLKDMVASGKGKILNVASIGDKLPGPLQSACYRTRTFVHSFTQAIREEVKVKGVVVTSLLPGATDKDFFNKAGIQQSKIVQEDKLDDPSKVARDGYNALMSEDDLIISKLKNKMQVPMSRVTGQTHPN